MTTPRLMAGLILVLTAVLAIQAPVQALDAQGIEDINNSKPWYDQSSSATDDDSTCSPTSANGTTEVPNQVQAANAQIIIGIAKTDNLGEAAAVIGVMVSLDEASLTNIANSTVKVSLTDPNAQGDPGSNADSVGLFQQRPVEGWSTLGNSDDQAEVFQIMTPAYAAEAFFGSPTGSNAPSALSKGLQNKPGWQNLEPWVAAQQVQVSVDKTGSNYEKAYGGAKTLVDQYWESAPAVPLPLAVTGGTPGTPGDADACTSTPTDFGTGTGKFTDTNTTVETAPDGETVAQWLVRVKETAMINPPSDLYNQLCGAKDNCHNQCDYLQGALWGYSNSGYLTALDQWNAEVTSGHGHPGDRNPPVGALLFYTSSDSAGHVAAYVGNNEVVSTDVGDASYTGSGPIANGGVYVVPASDLEGSPWNMPYLGWSDPNFTGGTL
jgi:hypothetical protein